MQFEISLSFLFVRNFLYLTTTVIAAFCQHAGKTGFF